MRADLADAQEPVKILSVAADPLPKLTQDENFNYDNGVWEVELATYTAGMTAIKDLTVTCEEVPEGASKKETAALLGKIDELTENLTSVIGFPDYSNSEMLITNKKGSGTITENGWLAIIESGAASEMTVKINNKISYTVRLANSLTIPVTTGDTWEVTYFTANCYLWFIPNKVF